MICAHIFCCAAQQIANTTCLNKKHTGPLRALFWLKRKDTGSYCEYMQAVKHQAKLLALGLNQLTELGVTGAGQLAHEPISANRFRCERKAACLLQVSNGRVWKVEEVLARGGFKLQ